MEFKQAWQHAYLCTPQVTPAAAHHDETGEYPWEILRKAWELGLMNTTISQDYGGLGN